MDNVASRLDDDIDEEEQEKIVAISITPLPNIKCPPNWRD
jgi:hypothetical protein